MNRRTFLFGVLSVASGLILPRKKVYFPVESPLVPFHKKLGISLARLRDECYYVALYSKDGPVEHRYMTRQELESVAPDIVLGPTHLIGEAWYPL